MNRAEESEKPPSFLTKSRKQNVKLEKPANRTRHQNRKTAIFKGENRETESKIGQIRKTENPDAPLLIQLGLSSLTTVRGNQFRCTWHNIRYIRASFCLRLPFPVLYKLYITGLFKLEVHHPSTYCDVPT